MEAIKIDAHLWYPLLIQQASRRVKRTKENWH